MKNKRQGLLLSMLFLGLTASLTSQNLNGWVFLQNSKKKPLPNVQISADKAGTTVSGTDGRFSMRFIDRKVGDRVALNIEKKDGKEWHVIDEDDWKKIPLSVDGELLKPISMCLKEDWEY